MFTRFVIDGINIFSDKNMTKFLIRLSTFHCCECNKSIKPGEYLYFPKPFIWRNHVFKYWEVSQNHGRLLICKKCNAILKLKYSAVVEQEENQWTAY